MAAQANAVHTTSEEASPLAMVVHTATEPSRLLTLPGELRNRIIELAMSSNKTITILTFPMNRPLHYRYWQTLPSILRTCRQLREEGISIYYSIHTFRFAEHTLKHPYAFKGFMVIRQPGVQHLQRVEIKHRVSALHTFL